jgi:hypothetical protein
MSRILGLALATTIILIAAPAEPATQKLDVYIKGRLASFDGQIGVSLLGHMGDARAKWNGSIRNTSSITLFRATFCIKAWDLNGAQIRPGQDECVIRMWANNWAPGTTLTFKGDQKIRIGEGKAEVRGAKFSIEIGEIFDRTPNQRTVPVPCEFVWQSAIKTFADRKFRPTVMDKSSLTATFSYDGGRIDSGVNNFLKMYTNAYTGWTVSWESFRVESASVYLRGEKLGQCDAEVKIVFAAFGKAMFGRYGWYAVESNYNLEKSILDEVEAVAKTSARKDQDNAISQLPTSAPSGKSQDEGIAEKLQRLADLHSKGLLTDEEFKQAKAKLLQ